MIWAKMIWAKTKFPKFSVLSSLINQTYVLKYIIWLEQNSHICITNLVFLKSFSDVGIGGKLCLALFEDLLCFVHLVLKLLLWDRELQLQQSGRGSCQNSLKHATYNLNDTTKVQNFTFKPFIIIIFVS